jgi:hypothetical protein
MPAIYIGHEEPRTLSEQETDIMRTLDLRPTNTTISDAATELLAGRAVGVVLRPGDMTEYRLLIAPCWERQFAEAAGGGVGDGGDYLLVSTQWAAPYALTRHAVPSYIAEKVGLGNLHTGEVIAGFLRNLWRALDERSR